MPDRLNERQEERRERRLAVLRQEVVYLLRSPAVQTISFLWGSGILVSPAGFREVADALGSPNPTLSVDVSPGRLRKHHAGAAYFPDEKTIVFRSFLSLRVAVGRGLAVHEAVHAMRHMKCGDADSMDEEGAAFLAQAWYHLNSRTRHASPWYGELLRQVEEVRSSSSLTSMVTQKQREMFKSNVRMNRTYKDVLGVTYDHCDDD